MCQLSPSAIILHDGLRASLPRFSLSYVLFLFTFLFALTISTIPVLAQNPTTHPVSILPAFSWRSVYAKQSKSVCLVRCGTERGAGFLYKDKHTIVTSLSVAGCGRTVTVLFPDQKEQQATLYAFEKKYDTALLKLKRPMPVAPLDTAKKATRIPGSAAIVIGHPFSRHGPLDKELLQALQWNVSAGVMGRVTPLFFQFNLPNSKGYIGGPVMNRRGQLLGMLTQLSASGRSLKLAVLPAVIARLLKKSSPPKTGWPYLAWRLNLNARFSLALGNVDASKIAPSNQELRLELIFWDQLNVGIYVGFDFLTIRADLQLSLLFGMDASYMFLMPRTFRPYLNHISLGLGVLTMRVNVNTSNLARPEGIPRLILWSGVRLYSSYGIFSLGMFVDIQDITNPVLSISWGF